MSFFERRVQEAMGNLEYAAGCAEAKEELRHIVISGGLEAAAVPVYFWNQVEPVRLEASLSQDGAYLVAAGERSVA
jgi:hypothetical protein